MIQRIQSLLLLGVALLFLINLFVPIWSDRELGTPIVLDAFSISQVSKPVLGTSIINNTKNVYYIGSIMIACIGLALYTVFQYKDRKKQLMYCNLLTVLSLLIIGSYFIAIPAAKAMLIKPTEGNYEIGYFIPLIASIVTLAARYFIRKDDNLVKSADRMR